MSGLIEYYARRRRAQSGKRAKQERQPDGLAEPPQYDRFGDPDLSVSPAPAPAPRASPRRQSSRNGSANGRVAEGAGGSEREIVSGNGVTASDWGAPSERAVLGRGSGGAVSPALDRAPVTEDASAAPATEETVTAPATEPAPKARDAAGATEAVSAEPAPREDAAEEPPTIEFRALASNETAAAQLAPDAAPVADEPAAEQLPPEEPPAAEGLVVEEPTAETPVDAEPAEHQPAEPEAGPAATVAPALTAPEAAEPAPEPKHGGTARIQWPRENVGPIQPSPPTTPKRSPKPARTDRTRTVKRARADAAQRRTLEAAPGVESARATEPVVAAAVAIELVETKPPTAPEAAPHEDAREPVAPEPAAPAPLGRRERAGLRRRARYLRQLREVQLRDLGGFVLELHRFETSRDDLVRAKLGEAAATDRELRALEGMLHEQRPLAEVRAAGIGGACRHCGAIHGSVDRFCAACGTPIGPASAPAREPTTVSPQRRSPGTTEPPRRTSNA